MLNNDYEKMHLLHMHVTILRYANRENTSKQCNKSSQNDRLQRFAATCVQNSKLGF